MHFPRYLLVTALFASLLVSSAAARAQSEPDPAEVAIAPIRVVGPPEERPAPADLVFDSVDAEPSRLLVWGPSLEPTACVLPCELRGDFGQYGVTVASGGASWSTAFVLERRARPARIRLR